MTEAIPPTREPARFENGEAERPLWEGEARLRSPSETDERAARDDLLDRGAILEAVGHASETLLKSGDWREAIDAVLPCLARSVGADAAFLGELSDIDDRSVRFRSHATWSLAEEAASPFKVPTMVLPIGIPEFRALLGLFRGGESAALLLRDLPAPIRRMHEELGILASISLPVWVGDRIWGVLGFADRQRVRSWSTVQLDTLRLAATNVGWAIHRGLIADESARRHAILAAVRHTADRLLGAESWTQAIPAILAELGAAAGVSRAYIFERHPGRPEDWVVSPRSEWAAEGVSAQLESPSLQSLSLSDFVEPKVIEDLNHGSAVQFTVRKLRSPVRDFLGIQEILSIALVPVLPGGEPWGFIGFDDREQERSWSAGELDALRAAASLLAAAILRERLEEERRRSEQRLLIGNSARQDAEAILLSREKLLEAVGFAAERFLGNPDWESSVVEVLDRFNAATGLGRVFLWREPGPERADPLGLWLDRSGDPMTSDALRNWFNLVLPDVRPRIEALGVGEATHVMARDLPAASRTHLMEVGIESGLFAPVFVDGTRWGVFGFSRRQGRREWSASETEVMRMAARILGVAIARARTEERLHIANATLENMTIWAQEKAQEAIRANAAKSSFLAGMSHEIRTPLTGVLGTLELLQDTPLDPAQQEMAAIAMRSSHTLLALINDVLDFSKIESGKLELESIEFDLRELVEDAVELLAESAATKALALAAVIDPRILGPVRGDPVRLRQILVNLLGNAVKFTDQGEVVIRVTCEMQDADSMVLQFLVQDTGVGISVEAREKLFHAFTQADMSTTRKYGGTGLGLTISRRLVEAMGGFIRLESVPGRGSEFAFTICLARDRVSSRTASEWVSVRPGVRVLVLSRHAPTRDAIAAQLAVLGAEAALAADGAEAIRILDEAEATGRRVDLALIESRLDREDGSSIVEAFERHPASATMSLGLLDSFGERSARLPTDGRLRLAKPLRLSRLEQTLRELRGAEKVHSAMVQNDSALEGMVLVVDDNPVNRQVTTRMVQSLGPSAESVEDGAAALEAVRRGGWSLVLMDHQMPVMDGLEATRKIRALPGATGRLPIVAVTATSADELRAACLECGMDDFLTKPIRRDLLRAILVKWLPAHRAAA